MALALSRRRNESIIITAGKDRITVTVVDIRGDKVRLIVKAPRTMPIHRAEVQRLIDARAVAG